MTQAFNLALLANKVNSSGLLDASTGLTNATPVANGGTGLSTLTANNLIVGNGTSAVQFIAPGASGNFLTSNGTSWVSTSTTLYAGAKSQIFSSSGSFTVPAGISSLKVTVIGGGGGCASNTYWGTTANGGYGGMAIGYISVTAGSSYSITVGNGGNGATSTTSSTTTATAGGSSSFSTLISATGGGGGVAVDTTSNGSNGSGSNGTIANFYITSACGFAGNSERSVDSTSPSAWSATNGLFPGGRGVPYNRPAFGYVGVGGIGGVVLIEW
jgi:hypothetical protein